MPKEDVDTGKLLHAFEVLIKSHPAFQTFIRLDEDFMYVQYPFIIRTTSVDLNDTFRIRNQGVMRNIRGIDGIPSEKVDLVNESAVAGRMNLQLLEDPSGGLSLCLTYGDQWYLRETVEKVMQLLRESIIMIVRDN